MLTAATEPQSNETFRIDAVKWHTEKTAHSPSSTGPLIAFNTIA